MPANPSGCCPGCCSQFESCPPIMVSIPAWGCGGLRIVTDEGCTYRLDDLDGCSERNVQAALQISADGCSAGVAGICEDCGEWQMSEFVINSCDPIDISITFVCGDTGQHVEVSVTE